MAFSVIPSSVEYRLMREVAFVLYLGLIMVLSGAVVAKAEHTGPDGTLSFDIPAQPLAGALEAYSEATGIEIYYDGTLAIGRRSSAVKGRFPPDEALVELLGDTGCVSKQTGLGTISIVAVPPQRPPPVIISLQDLRQFDPYFALLQGRLSQALCASDDASPGSPQIVFKFWIDVLGRITHVEILNSSDHPARNQAILSVVEGMLVGEPPPADMPEPLIMTIYPPQAGEAPGCPSQ